MKGIDPKYAYFLGLAVVLEQIIGHGGSALLSGVIPDAWILHITATCNLLATLGAAIMTYQIGFSSAQQGPLANSSPSSVKPLAVLTAIIAGLVFFAPDARAADVATAPAVAKTNPFANLAAGYPYQTQGLYYGVYTEGGGGSVQGTATGVNSNSLVTNEIGVGGTIGYAWGVPKSNVFVATEAMFGWKNFNATNAGFSLSGPASFEQRIKIGTPLNTFLSMLPGLGLPSAPPFPAMPNGQTVSNVQAYIMAGIHEDDNSLAYGLQANRQWTIAPSIGIGMLGQLPNGVATDVWVETVFPDKSICAGPYACANTGQKVLAGLAFYY